MTKTIELAKKAGMRNLSGIEKFAELVRADERARLLAVAGEPVAVFYRCVLCHAAYEDEPVSECDCATKATTFTRHVYHSEDQVAAAVLKEREACAKVCRRTINLLGNRGWHE